MQQSESADLRTELQNLDAEVSRVQALLESLLEKRAHVKRKLNNLVSPILRLPPEISSEIFTLYLRHGLDPDLPFISSSPFLLGKICSSWRELVWSLSSLWSSVSMDIQKITPSSYATLLDGYLSRSEPHPLSIGIKGPAVRPADSTAMLDIMGIIARFSERWGEVAFHLSLACYEALRQVQGRVPILRHMVLYLQPEDLTSDYEPFEMFGIAPRLGAATLDGFREGSVTLPNAQLISLCTSTTSVELCLQLLHTSPRLISGTFRLLPPSGPTAPVFHVTTSHVQFLKFRLSSVLSLSSLLDNLSVPSARQLVISLPTTTMAPFPCLSLVSLITRSGCVLQSLSLTGSVLENDELFHCLQAIPSLAEVSLNCHGISDRFIGMLNPLIDPGLARSLATPLLPNLQILKITARILFNFTGLCDMLAVRWRPPSSPDSNHYPITRLLSATIIVRQSELTMHSPPTQIASLGQLVEDGMQISLVVSNSTWV